MEKLAASLGSKMTGSSPEMLNNLPGMEVIFSIIIIIFITAKGRASMKVIIVIIITIINTSIVIIVATVKDIDFKKLKATMEAAKKAEDQIQKTGEMAYNQVTSL